MSCVAVPHNLNGLIYFIAAMKSGQPVHKVIKLESTIHGNAAHNIDINESSIKFEKHFIPFCWIFTMIKREKNSTISNGPKLFLIKFKYVFTFPLIYVIIVTIKISIWNWNFQLYTVIWNLPDLNYSFPLESRLLSY